MILDAATDGGSVMLEPYLENLLAVLFPQVGNFILYTGITCQFVLSNITYFRC